MDAKSKGMIATIASVVLCGCPGLFLCIFGVATAFGGGTYDVGGSGGSIPSNMGYVFLCLSLIFILIPIVVGFFTLRKKTAQAPSDNTPPTDS